MQESDENQGVDQRQQLFEYAALGREIAAFWDSRMGEYLLKRADDEYVRALQTLKTCDPTNAALIVKSQGEVWRAESFRGWMSEAIRVGLMAEQQLEDRDDEPA